MTRALTIGTLFGSELRLHWSWPLLPAATAAYSLAVFPAPEAIFWVLLLLATYLCVLAHEAVQLLHEGLLHLPKWPDSGYRPKVELYGNQDDVWKQHRDRLEGAQREQPKNADLLFLLGYLAWFDGERVTAVGYFQQSRALAAETRWADLFLKAGKVN